MKNEKQKKISLQSKRTDIMEKEVYLYGAGGHALVIAEIVELNGNHIAGISDRNEDIKEFRGLAVDHTESVHTDGELIVSIGGNSVRRRVAERLAAAGGRFGVAIHPAAIVSESAEIGEGSVVMAGAIINPNVKIGKHCIINTGAVIDHECVIGDYVHVSPHATLCGQVSVGEGTWIGAGTTVIQCLNVGAWSVIGAGSVVVNDIPDNVKAFGNKCAIRNS